MDKPRWLPASGSPEDLPPASEALDEPNGLLAVGGSLDPEWLLAAYAKGVFPWYEAGQPILWWSPDPRAVLLPDELHVSRRLARTIRKSSVRISADTSFAAVVEACAAPRHYTSATWITPQMRDAYVEMHRLGWAHSFEAWDDDELIGGIYGLAVGNVYFGESMFSRRTDASKIAFVHGVAYLLSRGFELIDCQVWSHHLKTLGARTMPREKFLRLLDSLCSIEREPGPWSADYERFSQSTPE